MAPNVIGPYRILETLGSGGVGTVYRAVNRQTSELVALKLLSTGSALDPKAARRLAREFETLADLSHPNIVKVFDTGVYQGYPYLAMELVEGLTLRHFLDLDNVEFSVSGLHTLIEQTRAARETSEKADPSQEGKSELRPLPFGLNEFAEEIISEAVEYDTGPESVKALARAADEPDTDIPFSNQVLLPFDPSTDEAALETVAPPIDVSSLNRPQRVGRLKDAMLQISKALSYIHGHGLVHRDLKPSNIMVDQDRLVRLMDFGLAKFLADDSSVTANGRMVGTYRYMSPEQVLGEPIDARADLYSLGVILYEMLTGGAPFDAKTPYELWQKILDSDAPNIHSLNPRADLQLAKVAHKLIRKEPNDRFQTAEEVFEALTE